MCIYGRLYTVGAATTLVGKVQVTMLQAVMITGMVLCRCALMLYQHVLVRVYQAITHASVICCSLAFSPAGYWQSRCIPEKPTAGTLVCF